MISGKVFPSMPRIRTVDVPEVVGSQVLDSRLAQGRIPGALGEACRFPRHSRKKEVASALTRNSQALASDLETGPLQRHESRFLGLRPSGRDHEATVRK